MGWNDKSPYGIKAPCYKCEKRQDVCHDHCQEYKEFKAKINALNKKERERKKAFTTDSPYTRESVIERQFRKKYE